MNAKDLAIVVGVAAAVVLIGSALAKGKPPTSKTLPGYVPQGFAYDDSYQAWTRVRTDGVREFYT